MERKSRRNIVVLIGVTVLLLIGMVLGWFFVLVRPQREQIAKTEASYETDKATAAQLKENLSKEKKALDSKRYLDGQLAFFQHRYSSFDFPDLKDPASETPEERGVRIKAWRRYVRELYSDFGEHLESVLIAYANDSDDPTDGSKFILHTKIKVDTPPRAPEDLVVPSSGFLRPLSQTNSGSLDVTVTGSFAEVEKFLANINRGPILMVVGNVKLVSGSGGGTTAGAPGGATAASATTTTTEPAMPGQITATFKITPYLVITGPGVHPPAGSDTGGAAGGAAPGAAPGGAPGAAPAPPGAAPRA